MTVTNSTGAVPTWANVLGVARGFLDSFTKTEWTENERQIALDGVRFQLDRMESEFGRLAAEIAALKRSTPLRADPEAIQRGQQFVFDPPLDAGIRDIVVTLVTGGVETFESCEGGVGHAFPEPTVRFEGTTSEGPRALAVAVAGGLPVCRLRRAWGVIDGMMHGPWWEMTFSGCGRDGTDGGR